ncbi:uncharacterized protein LOC110376175 isoform X2 [Helicoverpa armigera]|uniref:uncharacterized protein LOC110376175 isoform X2 n=1 Tax=Helicoverpa armigera TaxID=29058 RepID=UPI003082C0B6
MLFINFLCLLYLMVLIDSHTISKSIDNDEKVDDVFDSITDLDHTRNPKLRRDRNLHKYRADYKDEYVRPESFKITKLYEEPERSSERTTAKATTEHGKHHKSAKRRVGSFWKKIRGKEKKNKLDETQRKRRIPKNKEIATKAPSTKEFRNPSPRNKSRRKNANPVHRGQSKARFVKRDVSATYGVLFTPRRAHDHTTTYKLEIGITSEVDDQTKKSTKLTLKPIPATAPASPTSPAAIREKEKSEKKMIDKITERVNVKQDNLTGMIDSMTTQIGRLKQIYGLEKFGSTTEKTRKFDNDRFDTSHLFNPSSTAQPTEADFPGTAQIEHLLNDIKSKAIQMVSEQNPLVTDIITNTVTEATFEADPLLTHIAMTVPGYYLNTFVSINEILNANEKRTVGTTGTPLTSEVYLNRSKPVTNTESHYMAARSIKEDTMTIAHNVEDMLQRELKNIYNKVKHKVSADFRKEVHRAKSTIKEGLCKISSRTCSPNTTTTSVTTKPTTTTKTTTTTTTTKPCHCKNNSSDKPKYKEVETTGPRHNRGDNKEIKVTNDLYTAEPTNPTPTYDDYMMLTLYEEMLAKTHENNVRKLLATSETPLNLKKRREHYRLSKRNPETLTDVKLKEEIAKLYDDNMPDYDYIEPSANVNSTAQSSAGPMDVNIDNPTSNMGNLQPTEPSEPPFKVSAPPTTDNQNLGDTSFEGLSNKISYNDFVNGYRHYLKFQKEQNNQNFSALVKYQAHRHHSVDDIGKYILNKIPPLPSNNRMKRFFDDTDIDYQEITTKSDDSWFRKHFYLFIDNGPPKKFHTSQTVELKSAAGETTAFVTEPMPKIVPKSNLFIKLGTEPPPRAKDTSEMSLDDLAKILDSIKTKQSASPFYRGPTKGQKDSLVSAPPIIGTEDIPKNLPHSFIGKLFGGKRRQAPRKAPTTVFYDIFNENTEERMKRTVTKDDLDVTLIDDYITKPLEDKVSTVATEVFAEPPSLQPPVRTSRRETNKYGYVDIDLVPRQTAVVKLRDDTRRSRFKNFLKKFSLKRFKHKKKHVKRSYYDTNIMYTRKTRFNPIKKLKDIFKVKADEKEEKSGGFRLPTLMPDYDMMTSHIDTFKPVKYDKPMTIDEMQRQIPNISDVIYDAMTSKTKKTTHVSSYMYRLDENDRNLLYNYHVPTSAGQLGQSILGVRPVWLAGGIPFTGLSGFQKGKETTSFNTEATTTTTLTPTTTVFRKPAYTTSTPYKTITRHKCPPSNVMTVNVKTLKKGRPTSFRTTTKRKPDDTTTLMTLDDMNFILNRIQSKLLKTMKPYQKVPTPCYKRGTLNFKKNQYHVKQPFEELTIKSKLTRIAKFPISKRHFKTRHANAEPIVNVANDYASFHDETGFREHVHPLNSRNAPADRRKPQNNRKVTPAGMQKYHFNEKWRYTDYFNDLLMWHNDILNMDKVPSPLWKNILNNIQPDSHDMYTTPNMNNLLKELNDLSEFLGNEPLDANNPNNKNIGTNISINLMSKEPRNNIRSLPDFGKQGIARSVAMNDNTLMTGKNYVIQGEAKYYQYNQPKSSGQLNSNHLLNNLNKVDVYNNNKYKASMKKLGGNRRSKPYFEKEEPAIIVDTTLFAYDDEADSITEGMAIKKQSRNSQKIDTEKPPKDVQSWTAASPKVRHFARYSTSRIHLPATLHSILKTNKPPLQYYTTPLPMKSQDFNNFLKENKMDVESVTSPMIELPRILEKWTSTHSRHFEQEAIPVHTTKANTTLSTKRVQLTQKLAKLAKIHDTKTIDKSMKFTDKLMVKPMSVSPQKFPTTRKKAKNPYFDDFDRCKRYSQLNKFVRFATTTPEFNYYNIIKKKMRGRLFEKKAPDAIEKPTTDMFTVDPHSKEVEITIINFDDIDKITPAQMYENFAIASKKEEDVAVEYPERTEVSSEIPLKELTYGIKDFIPKEEMHNELLYKDIFKEQTSSTTTEFTARDCSKSTEYIDHSLNDMPSAAQHKLRYPFDKMPQIYPNILGKIPHHPKNFNVPKRVHISSHHYKYDIFYDDNSKKTMKGGIEQSRPKQSIDHRKNPPDLLVKMKVIRNPTIFRKGETKMEMIRKIDRTAKRYRHARSVSASEDSHGSTHKRRLFTWRGCKPKPEGGLSAPGEDLDSPGATPVDTTRVTRHAGSIETTEISASTTSSPSSIAEPTPQPGSLVYDLKHMRRTTSAAPEREEDKQKDKEKDKDKECERHRRLFKISALIQDRFKSLMKNLTTVRRSSVNSTKRAAITPPTSKRTCNCTHSTTSAITSRTKPESDEDDDDDTPSVPIREDLKPEGFRITYGPDPTENVKKSKPKTTKSKKKHRKHHHKKKPVVHDDVEAVIEDYENEKGKEEEAEEENVEAQEKQEMTTLKHRCQSPGINHKGKQIFQEMPAEALYVEPNTYNDQSYYELGAQKKPPRTTITEDPDYYGKHYEIKRDLQNQNTFTAKDVAALEVIVDLMKNTLSYEEKDIASVFQNNNYMVQNHATKSVINRNDTTNSIQVHIAIPFDFQNGKKRSPLDPIRVRKVFSAKMSTPVDLEYQVHSFEGTIPPTTTIKPTQSSSSLSPSSSPGLSPNASSTTSPNNNPTISTTICPNLNSNASLCPTTSASLEDGLSPGMYLLVDKPKSGYALRPVKTKADNMKTRQVSVASTTSMPDSTKPTETRDETTSIKSLAKVTLSKEFIAAVNKHLIEMYENMTRVNKEVNNKTRKGRSVRKIHKIRGGEEGRESGKRSSERYTIKRHIDWEAVKKYFGHDRVCNCKCRSNKAMCRACAASDAVIEELIFEFDNLGRYMRDHCTEIQTFFWMNPLGGQKLRESVSRIDKSLGDYYKRVKGKCQGRTCKTFTTYIDKRQIVKSSKVPKKDVFSHLVTDLTNIAEDLNRTISLKTCFNEKLLAEGERFVNALNNCLSQKTFDKRATSNSTKKKMIKNVYSLDNINVNIICNPEVSSSPSTEDFYRTTAALATHLESSHMVTEPNLFDYEVTEPKLKKRKGFKKLFPRKNKKKLFTYCTSSYGRRQKINFKREIDAESYNFVPPLISDGGGSFWLNYLKISTNEPRIVRESRKNKPNIEIAVVQKAQDGTSMVQKITEPLTKGEREKERDKDGKKKGATPNSIYMTIKTSPKRKYYRDTESTTDYLTHNINQLLQLFGSLQDIEAMNQHSNRSTMFLNRPTTNNDESSILDEAESKPRPKTPKPVKKLKCKDKAPDKNGTTTTTPAPKFPKKKLKPKEPEDSCDNIIIRGTTEDPNPRTSLSTIRNITSTEKAESEMSETPTEATTTAPTSALVDVSLTNAFDTWSSGTIDSSLGNENDPTTASNAKDLSDSAIAHTEISTAPTTARIVSKGGELKESLKPIITTKPVSTKSPKKPPKVTKSSPKPQAESDDPNRPIYQDDEDVVTTTTQSSGFFHKLKTATLRFFDAVAKSSIEIPEPTSSTAEAQTMMPSIRDKLSTGTDTADLKEPSQVTTRPSPTIVIINEYDNQISSDILNDPNKDAAGYRNLLLSIIQYETNKLNDEWHRIAYGGDKDKDEGNVRRSVIEFRRPDMKGTAKPRKNAYKLKDEAEEEYDIFQGMKSLKNLEMPEPLPLPCPCTKSKKKQPSLLDRIASKIGIKVIPGKKKDSKSSLTSTMHTTASPQFLQLHIRSDLPEIVGKKPSVRETSKKKNSKRRRKLRLNSLKASRTATAADNPKASDSRRSTESSQICDIQATLDYITNLQGKVPKEDFEALVKNISCYKYKPVDTKFFVPYKREGKRWDWIRNKRCLKYRFARVEESDFDDDDDDAVEFDDESDSFEKYVKGEDGIYKIVTRKKRTAGLDNLDIGLRNIPTLMPGQDELYVMVGDTVTLDCIPYPSFPDADGKYSWKTDRKRMLKQDNVQVEGVKVTIHNVEPRNVGSYTCSLDQTVQRNVRLAVMTVPAFDVVFLPIYKTEETCAYDDLKAIQSLGGMMSEETRCGKACSVRIDEPVCQRDRGTNSSLLRTTAVLSMSPLNVNCSLHCRRDIVSSLVMLSALNTPALSNIGIVMSKDGVNETLTPWTTLVRPVITHSLRKKDTNGHKEYHKLVSSLTPGKVDVVLNCPAGYYLLPDYKLCSSCPANTRSLRGDNTCTRCPRGTHAPPGATECLAATPPRRYDWWWYPPCGYLVACVGLVLGCTVCLVLSVIVHFVSKEHKPKKKKSVERELANTPKTGTSVTAAFAHAALAPHSRPLSPSRVILPRFFKPSLTSSRATDSQETKFELWKERNKPPPLPPIDFDF